MHCEALQTPQVSEAVWQVLQLVVVQVEVPQAGEARKGSRHSPCRSTLSSSVLRSSPATPQAGSSSGKETSATPQSLDSHPSGAHFEPRVMAFPFTGVPVLTQSQPISPQTLLHSRSLVCFSGGNRLVLFLLATPCLARAAGAFRQLQGRLLFQGHVSKRTSYPKEGYKQHMARKRMRNDAGTAVT